MSATYRVVFILSILMFFFVLFAGTATNSKSSGFGMWIWGYTAWLMYKRRNADLVSFYKMLLWFDAIAGIVAIAVLSFSSTDVTNLVGYSVLEVLILFVLVILMTFGLYKYFLSLEPISTAIESINSDDTTIWDQVSDEVKSGKRVDSLWTRAFSESDGDSNKADALYLKLRFEQIKSEIKASQNSLSISSLPKISSKVNPPISDNSGNFNMFGKLALIGIFLLIGYGILNGNMDSFFQSTKSSKDFTASSQSSKQSASSPNVSPKNENCVFVWNDIERTFLKMDDDILKYSDKHSNTFIVKIGKESYYQSLIVQLRKADSEGNTPLAMSIAKEIRDNSVNVYFDKNLNSDYINLLATQQNIRSKCL